MAVALFSRSIVVLMDNSSGAEVGGWVGGEVFQEWPEKEVKWGERGHF